MRGVVTGTSPGDSVEVWFEGGGERSDSFTYRAVSETGRRVLVVAAEDYTGPSPVQTPGPHYLSYYLNALAANGVTPTCTTSTRAAASRPTISACSATTTRVIWYTGDDNVTRPPGQGGGNADRLAMDEILEFRAYMNEGGRVAVHRRVGRPAVRPRRRGRPAVLRPEGRGSVQPAAGRLRPAAVPRARRLAEQRRDQRRPASTGSARTRWPPATGTIPTRASISASTGSPIRSSACPGCSGRTAPTTRT